MLSSPWPCTPRFYRSAGTWRWSAGNFLSGEVWMKCGPRPVCPWVSLRQCSNTQVAFCILWAPLNLRNTHSLCPVPGSRLARLCFAKLAGVRVFAGAPPWERVSSWLQTVRRRGLATAPWRGPQQRRACSPQTQVAPTQWAVGKVCVSVPC